MKQILLYMSVLCLLNVPTWAQSTPQFFSALNDIPLMVGLREVPELTSTFDKPEGRIIESMALIESVSVSEVKKFYAQTLPQMGWKYVGEGLFSRENEQLVLSFESERGQEFMKIMVRPSD